MELGDIGSGKQFDVGLGFVAGLLVVLSQLLTDLGGGGSNDGVLAGVVIRRAFEHLYSQRAFFQGTSVAGKCPLGDIAQQDLATAATLKQVATKHLFQ